MLYLHALGRSQSRWKYDSTVIATASLMLLTITDRSIKIGDEMGFLMLWYPSKALYRELTVLQLGSMRPFLICETRLSTPLYVPRAIDEATVSNCSARPRNLA